MATDEPRTGNINAEQNMSTRTEPRKTRCCVFRMLLYCFVLFCPFADHDESIKYVDHRQNDVKDARPKLCQVEDLINLADGLYRTRIMMVICICICICIYPTSTTSKVEKSTLYMSTTIYIDNGQSPYMANSYESDRSESVETTSPSSMSSYLLFFTVYAYKPVPFISGAVPLWSYCPGSGE